MKAKNLYVFSIYCFWVLIKNNVFDAFVRNLFFLPWRSHGTQYLDKPWYTKYGEIHKNHIFFVYFRICFRNCGISFSEYNNSDAYTIEQSKLVPDFCRNN